MTSIQLPNLLDIPTLADHLGVTERHLRRLVFEKRIPYVKVGRLVRFDPAEIATWIDRSRNATATSGGRSPMTPQ